MMKRKLTAFMPLLALVLVLLGFAPADAQTLPPTNCTSIPARQFAQSTSATKTMNGVNVTRSLTRSLYSTTYYGTCATVGSGYAWLRAEDTSTSQSVTYTFATPITSVQVFLLVMGNEAQPYSYDEANFTISGGGSSNSTMTLTENSTSFDCYNTINISGSKVSTTMAYSTTNAAIVVSSTTPFTTLTITNPRAGYYGYTNDGYGYYVELCPTSLCPIPAITAQPQPKTLCLNDSTTLSVTATAGQTYQWYSNITNSNTGGTLISGATSATYTPPTNVVGTKYYYVEVKNSCSSTATKSNAAAVTVNALPTITGATTVAQGSIITLTGSPTPAAANPWVSASPSVATVSSTGVVTGVAPGTAVITYTNSSGCKTTTTITVTLPYCYKPATSGTGSPTNHGITSLQRAGANNGNWPMVRTGAHTALEAKTKGFVINRMANPETSVANPVEGMLVFDTDDNAGQGCLKLYDGTSWKCLNTQTCPQ